MEASITDPVTDRRIDFGVAGVSAAVKSFEFPVSSSEVKFPVNKPEYGTRNETRNSNLDLRDET